MLHVTSYQLSSNDMQNWLKFRSWNGQSMSVPAQVPAPYQNRENFKRRIPSTVVRRNVEAPRVQTSAATVLPFNTESSETINLQIPLPGLPGQFTCTRPWGPAEKGMRYMELRSMTPHSFIESIYVLGDSEGSVKFEINFAVAIPQETCDQFIKDLGFAPNPVRGLFHATNQAEMMSMIRVVAQNELPSHEFEFMKRLSLTRNWLFVEQMLAPSSPHSVVTIRV